MTNKYPHVNHLEANLPKIFNTYLKYKNKILISPHKLKGIKK